VFERRPAPAKAVAPFPAYRGITGRHALPHSFIHTLRVLLFGREQVAYKQKKLGNYLLSRPSGGSTIGARGLDFRVRNGNGYNTSAIITKH
jgi:hypothetical protein